MTSVVLPKSRSPYFIFLVNISLAIGSFAISTEMFSLPPLLYGANDLGRITPARVGEVVSVYSLIYAFAGPVLNLVLHRVGRHLIIILSLVGFIFAEFAVAASHSAFDVSVRRGILAIFACLYMPSAFAYSASLAGSRNEGRAISLIYAGNSAALIVGAPACLFVSAYLGWRFAYVAEGALCLLVLLGIAIVRTNAETRGPRLGLETWRLLGSPQILLTFALTGFMALGNFAIYTHLAIIVRSIGGANGLIPASLSTFGVAGVLGVIASGLAADRLNMKWLKAALSGAAALAMGAMSLLFYSELVPSTILICVAVWGASGWAFNAVQQAYLTKIARASASFALAVNGTALYLGVSAGAWLGAVGVGYGGARIVPVVGCGATLIAFVLTILFHSSSSLAGPAAEGESAT